MDEREREMHHSQQKENTDHKLVAICFYRSRQIYRQVGFTFGRNMCRKLERRKMYSKIFNKIRVEIFHGERKEIEPHLFFFRVIYESQAWCVTERKLSETIQR
jgi:hypothetical protein